MRTIVMATLLALGTPALAGEGGEVAIQPSQLPVAVRHAVEAHFHHARITAASKEDGRYEASILVGGEKRDVAFDAHGKLLETERPVTAADLPKPVSDMLELKYAQWAITHAEISDRPGHESVYEVRLKRGDDRVEVALAKSGDVLKTEVQDEDDDED